jgi:RNA polymerase sigma-70 factor (sigma-E family)
VATKDGFSEFVSSRSRPLHRTAYLLTQDWPLAEDLLQTTLTKVWLSWGRIEHDIDGYTYQVMVHTYTSWWRRKWRGEIPTEKLPDFAEASDSQDGTAVRQDLWNALGRLPRRQRAVLVLRFFLDLSERETALVMECAPGTVKSQTSKALAKLRLDPSIEPERLPQLPSALAGGELE